MRHTFLSPPQTKSRAVRLDKLWGQDNPMTVMGREGMPTAGTRHPTLTPSPPLPSLGPDRHHPRTQTRGGSSHSRIPTIPTSLTHVTHKHTRAHTEQSTTTALCRRYPAAHTYTQIQHSRMANKSQAESEDHIVMETQDHTISSWTSQCHLWIRDWLPVLVPWQGPMTPDPGWNEDLGMPVHSVPLHLLIPYCLSEGSQVSSPCHQAACLPRPFLCRLCLGRERL